MQTRSKWIDRLHAITFGLLYPHKDVFVSSREELYRMAEDADKYYELRNTLIKERLKKITSLLSRACGLDSHLYLGEPIRVKANAGQVFYVWCLGIDRHEDLYASDGTNGWYKVDGEDEDYNIIEAIFKQLPALLKQALK